MPQYGTILVDVSITGLCVHSGGVRIIPVYFKTLLALLLAKVHTELYKRKKNLDLWTFIEKKPRNLGHIEKTQI